MDIDKIRADLEANGVNVIQGDRPTDGMGSHTVKNTETSVNSNKTITTVQSEEVVSDILRIEFFRLWQVYNRI